MNKHTPTPWKVSSWYDKDKGKNLVIKSTDNKIIADMQWQIDDTEKANADFLTRAVNSHEQLLLAVKGFRQYLSLDGRQISELDEIIAKAEGKEATL